MVTTQGNDDLSPRGDEPAPSMPRLVVGIGASAGGMDACKRFLGAMPAQSNLAVVIVLHLDPDHESHLVSLLEPGSAMRVMQVQDGQTVEPDSVYVIAPNTSLEIRNGVLHIRTPRDPALVHKPVDAFFSSLAEDQGRRAVAVILSGMGNNGSGALADIKARGGLCLVQAPESAAYDAMPRNAIATGSVDAIALPEEMPDILLAYDAERPLHATPPAQRLQPENLPAEFDAVLALLARRYQLNLSMYKKGTLMRRTERRMALKHITALRDYLVHLEHDPHEVDLLYADLLIGVTQFFRDPELWKYLEETAVPAILGQAAKEGRDAPLRIWVPGCTTGEEAYSLAMVFLDQLRLMERAPRLQIFASDMNERGLAFARRGLYPAEIARDVSEERLRRFFEQEGEHFQIRQQVRETVTFAVHNVLTDPPFSRLDLVSCRNLLIYLEQPAQERVLELFQFALRPAGLLVLGTSETIGRRTDIFESISKSLRVYRASALARTAATLRWFRGGPQPPDRPAVPATPAKGTRTARVVEQYVLSRLTPASVAITQGFEILSFFGPTHDYLSQPTGEARLDLLAWLKPGLYAGLRGGLKEAVERKERVTVTDMRVERGAERHRVACTIEPILNAPGAEGLLLVTFRDVVEAQVPVAPGEESEEPLVRHLEQELKSSRHELENTIEHLEVTNEEYRASHEELLSLNEELQSSNEELETSKEELQSLNEETITINRQLEERNNELRRVVADLNNLLTSNDVPTIFLDRDLGIRWFSPAATEIMRLVPSDVGRSIEHIKERFQDEHLLADIERVLKSLVPAAAEVSSHEGRWYARRVLPYRTVDDRIDGVCLTYGDITEQKIAAASSEEARTYAEAIVRTLRTPLLVLDGDLRVVSANESFYSVFQVSKDETESHRLYELGNRQWDIPALRTLLETILRQQNEVKDYDVEHRFEHIGLRQMRLNAGLMARADRSPLILLSIEDVTAQKNAARAAEERAAELVQEHRRKDEFLAMLGHELRNPLTALTHGLEVLDTVQDGGARSLQVRGMMARQAKRIRVMLDQLLDIARVISGKIEIAREEVDIAYVAHAALETVAPLLEMNPRELEVSLPQPGTARVRGDVVRLTQVLENLLTNAVKYTEDTNRIWLAVQVDDSNVRISVRDDGVGLAADFIPHAFDLFTQAPRSLARSKGGLGLGLPLIRGLVELHGGQVEASSAGPGKGSEFVVTLPRLRGSRETARGESPMERSLPAAPSYRIMVVDDEEDVADTLATLLERRGHKALAAHDGPAALTAVRTFEPDVMLVDIGMPGMDGYEVAARVREQHGHEPLRLIAMTGYQKDVDALRAAGFDHHLLKPLDLEQLVGWLAAKSSGPTLEA